VLGSGNELIGVVTRNQLIQLYQRMPARAATTKLSEIATLNPQVAFADEPLRTVVNRMADSGFTRFPVLNPSGDGKIVGMVALNDLLHARTRNLEDESGNASRSQLGALQAGARGQGRGGGLR
jgi:CBS-domain-containing membrane protein